MAALDKSHIKNLISMINRKPSDVVLVSSDGESIHTWRLILCIYSSYWANMFSEIHETEQVVIYLPDYHHQQLLYLQHALINCQLDQLDDCKVLELLGISSSSNDRENIVKKEPLEYNPSLFVANKVMNVRSIIVKNGDDKKARGSDVQCEKQIGSAGDINPINNSQAYDTEKASDTGMKPFPCKYCSTAKFQKELHLKRHILNFHKKIVKCCGSKFYSYEMYYKHFDKTCTREKSIWRKGQITSHLKSRLTCHLCSDDTFNKELHLKKHLINSHQESVLCCGKKFNNADLYSKHFFQNCEDTK